MEATMVRDFLGLISIFLITKTSTAAKITVGGDPGWVDTVDYKAWASQKTFNVHDELVFKYSTLHSVVELKDETAYKNCDISTALSTMKTTGNNVVKLDKMGTRYFACGTPGHCSQGMKLKVEVGSQNASSSAPSPDGSSSSSSSTAKSSPAATASSAAALNSAPAFILMSALVYYVL